MIRVLDSAGSTLVEWGRQQQQQQRMHETYFSYLGNRINLGGGCEATVTHRIRIGWAKFREYQDLLFRRKFPLKIKGIVHKSFMEVKHGAQARMRGNL